jgi:hypothetical protein
MSQLHKRFTSDQVKELLERYLRNKIERKFVQEILEIKERRFFALLKPKTFTVACSFKSSSFTEKKISGLKPATSCQVFSRIDSGIGSIISLFYVFSLLDSEGFF